MNIARMLLSTLVVLTLLMGTAAAEDKDNGEKFVDIFNGKDLSGWVVDRHHKYDQWAKDKPRWTVADGMIRCSGKGGAPFLRYDKELSDFVLRIEYRMAPKCNSGLGIRGVVYTGPRKTRPSIAGYELQVLDDSGKNPTAHGSGSLYRYLAPKANATRPAGEWNEVEIECFGPRIRITLNDQIIHDIDQSQIEATKNKPLKGYFSVQNHGHVIEFRNVRLKEL